MELKHQNRLGLLQREASWLRETGEDLPFEVNSPTTHTPFHQDSAEGAQCPGRAPCRLEISGGPTATDQGS